MNRIIDYISNILYNEIAANKLVEMINKQIEILKDFPYLNTEINLLDDLGKKYRRIIVKNYVVLYTIDEENKNIYISNIFYGKSNYLKDSSKVKYKIKFITNYVKQTLAKK